jgi:tRNA (guanine6-N2)-methyltransferase
VASLSPVSYRFAAFATKGIEDLLAGEIARLIPESTSAPRTKLVLFTAPYTPRLRELRMADDICVVAGEPGQVRSLDEMSSRLRRETDLFAAVGLVRTFRDVGTEFSVTVTAARSAIGSSKDLREVTTSALARSHGWTPAAAGSRAPLDVRVFLDESFLLLGLRLYQAPLSSRPYRRVGTMGSLRPTVAAAMVRLATAGRTGCHAWDPFCGSGTILAEAFLAGHAVRGSDIDPAAVRAARENLATLDPALRGAVEQADATQPGTWLRQAAADTVVTNLPWGKQVEITRRTPLYRLIGEHLGARLADGGRACVLTTEPDRLLAEIRRTWTGAGSDVRRIGLLGHTPSLVTLQLRSCLWHISTASDYQESVASARHRDSNA